MSHLYESGFCVRQPSWHGLENLLNEWPDSIEDARKAAKMEWDPVSRPSLGDVADLTTVRKVLSSVGDADAFLKALGDAGYQVAENVDGFHRIVRDDTDATLAVMRDSYTIINNGEMFEVVSTLLGEAGVKWETAGVLDGGKQVFALAYLDEPLKIPGDKASQTYPYLVALNRHDGYSGLRVQYTNIRVVCANTFSAAEAEGDRNGRYFVFRHTQNWKDQIDDVKEAVSGARTQAKEFEEIANTLLKVRVNKVKVSEFVDRFIPLPPEGVISDRVRDNVRVSREAFLGCLNGPTTKDIAGTAWGLVQASTEYLDHLRGYRNAETYLGRTLLKPEPLKGKAIRLVGDITGTKVPTKETVAA